MLPHQLDREKTVQKFKTKVCIFWLQKNCPYGDRCLFAHGKDQLRADQGDSHVPGIDPEVNERYKTRLCRFFLNNEPCVHGVRCTYAHSHEEQAHYLKLAKDKGVQIFPPTISSAPASPSASHDHEMMNRSAVPFSAMNRLAATTQMPATAPMTTTTRSPWTAQGGLLHSLSRPSTTTPSLSMTLPTSATVTKRSLTPATYSAATTTPSSISKLDTGKTMLAANPFAALPPKVDSHLSSQQQHLVLASHHLSTSPPGNSPSQVGSIDSYTPFKPPHLTQLTANASVFVTGAASALIASEASSLAASTAASHSNTATTNAPLSPPPPSSTSTMNFEKFRDPLTGAIAVTKMSAGTLALYLNSAYVYNQNKDDHHGEGESTSSGPTPIPPGLGIVEETLAQALQAEELAGRRHLADLARKGLSSIHQNLSSIPPLVPPQPLVITHQPQRPSEFSAATWSQNQFKQQEIATAQEANDAVSNAIAQLVSALQLSEASRLASVQHQFPRQSLIHPPTHPHSQQQQQQQQQQNPLDLMAFLNRAQSNIRDQLPLAPMSRLEEVAHEWILGQSLQAPTSVTDNTQRSFYESGGDDSERSFLTLAASATTVSANSTTATNRSLHLSSSHLLDNSGSSPPMSTSRWTPPSQQHNAMSILGENSSASTSKTCESGSIWRPSAHSSESMIVHRTSAMPLLDLTRILQPQTVELKEDEGEDDEKGILLSLGLSKREDDLDDE